MWRDRFAPSPTGFLHLGHALSALMAWKSARKADGEFILRIEDIDTTRCREEYVEAIYSDLEWLGIEWRSPVMRQSHRGEVYSETLQVLIDLGVCYPCRCSRRDILDALAAPQVDKVDTCSLQHSKSVYPGTCRKRLISESGPNDAIRLNMAMAIQMLGGFESVTKLQFTEIGAQYFGSHCLDPRQLLMSCGDIVLARKDIKTSYHLSVVVDDGDQGITHVTRGSDLFEATQIHRLLQALLDIKPPIWNHHHLLLDKSGRRLAKRNKSMAIRELRNQGTSPYEIIQMFGL